MPGSIYWSKETIWLPRMESTRKTSFSVSAVRRLLHSRLILNGFALAVTRAGTDQRFRVRDLRRINYWPASIAGPTHGGMHGFQPQPHFQHFQHGMGSFGNFGHQSFGSGGDARRLIPGQDLAPKVFYLFTSASKDHEPYFSQTPVPIPLPKGGKVPELDPNEVRCFALVDM